MKRIKELDGIRGVAIILILIWHYFNNQIIIQGSSILSFFKDATALAWSGVDLFLMLSGFLIVGILFDNKGANNIYRVFFIRRICRIFPLYYLLYFVFLLLILFSPSNFEWLFRNPLPLLSYATFTQNFFITDRGFGAHAMGITWTIALLVQSYIFIVIMVKKLNRQKLMLLFGVLIICAPLFRLFISNLYNYVFFFCRADILLIGGLIALLVREDWFIGFLKKNKKSFVLLFALLFCGTIALIFKNHQIGNFFNHFWLALFYGMFVLYPFVFEKGKINNFFKSKTLSWLGSRSYAIFLLHQIVSGLMHGLFGDGKPLIYSLYTAGLTLTAFVITLVLAELSFRFLEKPLLKYGRSMKYKL